MEGKTDTLGMMVLTDREDGGKSHGADRSPRHARAYTFAIWALFCLPTTLNDTMFL